MASRQAVVKRELRRRVERFLAGGDPEVVSGPEATALMIELGRSTSADSTDFIEVVQLFGWLCLCRHGMLARRAALPDLRSTVNRLTPVYRTAPETLPTLLMITIELMAGIPASDKTETLFGKALNLMDHGVRTGDLRSVGEAITLFLDAAGSAPFDHPDRAAILANACSGWLRVYEMSGDRSAVDHAVRTGQDAVAALTPNAPYRAVPLNNLAGALLLRAQATGDDADLDRAVALHGEAVELTPRNDPEWVVRQNNLGIALGLRFERAGGRKDIDRAIAALQQAVDGIGVNRPQRLAFIGDLAYYRWVRFGHTGDPADLDAAAEGLAVASASPDEDLRHRTLSYLRVVEEERARRSDRRGRQ
jgi:hypothetical protein